MHLGAGGLAQVTAVVEHSGYGGGGDARQCGNVAEFGLRHGAPLWLRQDMLNDWHISINYTFTGWERR